MMKKISVAGPAINHKDIDSVLNAVQNSWYENYNSANDQFEKEFAKFVGKKYALSLPSCTSAIHLGLEAMGITKNDEVIVPDLTWLASVSPVTFLGATPIFVDSDRETWCITAEAIEKNITNKTKAVITVGLYGSMPDFDSIRKVASKYGLKLLEDAAESLGSTYNGKQAGSFGDVGVFSFHGTKTLTTGEGGMLVTDDEIIYKRCQMMSNQGRDPNCKKLFWMEEIGYKYKMSCLQAALGLSQLSRIDELVDKKRDVFRIYKEELGNIKGLSLNVEPPNVKNSYWMSTLVWDNTYNITKEEMIIELSKFNIDSRPFFYPLTSMGAFDKYKKNISYEEQNHVAYEVSKKAINLPSAMRLTEEDVRFVCDRVKEILSRYAVLSTKL